MKKNHPVVGYGQAKIKLKGERPQAVEKIEGMEQQARAGGRVEDVGEEEMGSVDQQSFLNPPLVPVILPAVKPVAGDSAAQMGDGWPGHQQGQQGVGG